MAKERNYGIDLLRILSMLMVVILHVLGQGGILYSTAPHSAQYRITWFMEIAAYCAVNCYALISGFVGLNSKFKYANIVYLWLQITFYTVSITAVAAYLLPEVGRGEILHALYPVSKETYWYFTAYFGVFFLSPLFNRGIAALSEKQSIALGIAIILLFSFMPTFKNADIFSEDQGYSMLWLSALYIIGAIMKKCDIVHKVNSWISILLYLICVLITWLQKICKSEITVNLVSYISPTILFTAIFLFIACARIHVGSFPKKLITFWSPLSFGVYIIHVHRFSWVYILQNRFVSYLQYSIPKLIFSVLGTAVILFLVCSLIDFVRDCLFKLFKVRETLIKLENKLLGEFWNN